MLARFFLMLFLLSGLNIWSQAVVKEPNQYESTWRQLQRVRNILNTQSRDNPIDFKDIKGSPYDSEKFREGEFMIGDKSYGTFYLRYNIYSDEIEVIAPDQLANVGTDKLELEAFYKVNNSVAVIEDTRYEFHAYADNKSNMKKGYLALVKEFDGFKLYKRFRCVMTPAQKAATFNEADRAAKFNIYEDYYILDEDNLRPRYIELKKKVVLKAFPEKEAEVKSFIKENKLKMKSEEDLVKLLDFISKKA